jgi:hypothetical protein
MQVFRRRRWGRLDARIFAGLALALLALTARARQEPAPPAPPVEPHGERGDLHEQMVQLFAQVERRMKRLSITLFDASAGDPLTEPVEESGIGTLVEQARTEGRQVCEDIDKILEIAKRHAHPSSGGS